jgi:D-alanine-D-alanine ligase
MSNPRVAVLMGGRSSEREVSLRSGQSVVEGLREAGHSVVPIEIDADGRWELPPVQRRHEASGGAAPSPSGSSSSVVQLQAGSGLLADVDVVFPVLHGPFGEDGTVQGLLELLDIAYVGAGVAASAVAMDKSLFKDVMRANDIPVAESVTVRAGHTPLRASPLGVPVVVKPARLGSSVGISIVREAYEFQTALAEAFAHDDKILIEEYVDGIEVECSVLGGPNPQASVLGEIVVLKGDWYDYTAKYTDGGMELVVPARVDERTTGRVRDIAVRAFEACDCDGMARVDFFVQPNGGVLVSELNTIPGFTATSVYAKLFEATGIKYPALLTRLVQLAVDRRARRCELTF